MSGQGLQYGCCHPSHAMRTKCACGAVVVLRGAFGKSFTRCKCGRAHRKNSDPGGSFAQAQNGHQRHDKYRATWRRARWLPGHRPPEQGRSTFHVDEGNEMILGRNLLTGLLVYSTLTPICRHCWAGRHHKCSGVADEWNKCECATWRYTQLEHAEGSLFKEMRT